MELFFGILEFGLFNSIFDFSFIDKKFLPNFQNNDYEEDKELKPGQKEDILEEKVIEFIKSTKEILKKIL